MLESFSQSSAPDPAEQIVQENDPHLLENLPVEQRERVLRIVQVAAMSFQGPLPPPQMLAQYNQLVPEGADRLMKLLELQTAHRIKQESKELDAQINLSLYVSGSAQG